MGDIKKIKKKYSKPSHPWMVTRIEEENILCREYGIPRRTELWKLKSKLESFKHQAKGLITVGVGRSEKQNNMQRENLLQKLQSYNLIQKDDTTDSILGVTLKHLLDRRLQTVVFKRGYAKTMKQSRQMITHRHVLVNNRIIASPSYLVKMSDESAIEISPKSPFYSEDHPERVKEATKRKPRVHDKKNDFKKRRK